MSINGISAGYYPTAYANTNIPKGTETASFGRYLFYYKKLRTQYRKSHKK